MRSYTVAAVFRAADAVRDYADGRPVRLPQASGIA